MGMTETQTQWCIPHFDGHVDPEELNTNTMRMEEMVRTIENRQW